MKKKDKEKGRNGTIFFCLVFTRYWNNVTVFIETFNLLENSM